MARSFKPVIARSELNGEIRKMLLSTVRAQFRISYAGHHGARHWGRVTENGLALANITGARPLVIELFALFHDSQRQSEGHDAHHGFRAARYVEELAGKLFSIAPDDLRLLAEACEGHTGGMGPRDVTIATCWDADRLDLGRVGIVPDRRYLCTDAAKNSELLDWAYQRSLGRRAPGIKWSTS